MMDGMLDVQALDVVRETFLLILLISAPILVVGLVVGLVVSIFQAVTQIQEQTLVFVPKILAMVATTVALFSWIAMKLMEFSAEMFTWSPVTGT
jgi:flagellar biosynthetic protein FliQ